MQTILNAEDEVLIASIIENKNWELIPDETTFMKTLREVEENSDESYKPIIQELINKIQRVDYNMLKKELNFILSYPS